MKKFSKDPKVRLLSIEQFYKSSNYLSGIKNKLWQEMKKPKCGIYYKITSSFLILIKYTFTAVNFGMDLSEKLDYILVAYRDGKTEHKLLDIKMRELLEEEGECKKSKKIDKVLKEIELGIKLLNEVKYSVKINSEVKPFEDYIVDVEYKTAFKQFKDKYVVFDVETNGTRKANDDLLSISIYDPTIGKCYNRYLPLELQPLVLTTWIHGINDKSLVNATHITQKELNKIIDFFDLKNKTLLSFSGGKGTFDFTFIINYCKRHNLVGFENLHYENIKTMFPNAGYGLEGQMSKDNLCRLLKIDGVQDVHSSMNDCILEWKLFEKIKTEQLFFIGQHLFKYHEGYIVPVSYLNNHPELMAFADIKVPYIVGTAKPIYEFSLPKKVLNKIKKFPTNITGISLENGINSTLQVEKQDNFEFLVKNKSYLEYIGSLDSRIREIPIEIKNDGTIMSLDEQYDDYIKEVNNVTKKITDCLMPVCDFIKNKIFKNSKIMSQELSISNDGKVLALCDLSNKECVLEIKTFNVSEKDVSISSSLARQLYYESNGRKTFILSIDIDRHLNNKNEFITDSVDVKIYRVTLEESVPKPIERSIFLWNDDVEILEMIKNNPLISNAEIARETGRNPNNIGKIIKTLVSLRYIEKEDATKRTSKWILLRDTDDIETKYSYFNGKITLLLDQNNCKVKSK